MSSMTRESESSVRHATLTKVLGYRFKVCEMTPGPESGIDCVRFLDYRDNLEDAQKIINVLNETDINFSVYVILAEPVYGGA